ncbi:hypothetical protein BCF55_0731 [Hydrogenivirga caldilitoris]|uniref:Uncharacterized protein n=1 Tax=Hydrogenivirga caldilitoris TaxID=246264 RepID=A0A497XNC3_9AQUI|nr:hypothetical protein [Hydrogenivirga caldilitoris]RLJ70456.1 hypothetical protein BCF55_0731 [Hydrogenivirga caldilitoris]
MQNSTFSMKIEYRNLDLRNLGVLLNDTHMVLRNIIDIIEMEENRKVHNKQIRVISINKGSIDIQLLSVAIDALIFIKILKYITKDTKDFIRELRELLDEISKLITDIHNKANIIKKRRLLDKKISLVNYLLQLSKLCSTRGIRLVLSDNRDEFTINKETYQHLKKHFDSDAIRSNIDIIVCGHVIKMVSKSKPYIAEVEIAPNIKLSIFFHSAKLFERLKDYLGPSKEKKVKLKTKLFINIKEFKKANKAYLVEILGPC